jgi:hypothetical protein
VAGAVYSRFSRPSFLQKYYLHRDHLGSVDRMTNISDGLMTGGNQWTKRGFTGHEHLDAVMLINMNGRVCCSWRALFPGRNARAAVLRVHRSRHAGAHRRETG